MRLTAGVCAVFGDEPLLKRLALQAIRASLQSDGEELTDRTYDGETAARRDVHDELYTASLFSSGPRLAIIDDAEKFVTANRDKLEDYAAKPASGVLVLLLDSLPGNTNLAKKVEKSGLAIECRVPASYRGKTKVVDEKRVVKWLVERAKKEHGAKLETSAAEEMLDLVGAELGLLDTDLAKLALFVEAGQAISADLVRTLLAAGARRMYFKSWTPPPKAAPRKRSLRWRSCSTWAKPRRRSSVKSPGRCAASPTQPAFCSTPKKPAAA